MTQTASAVSKPTPLHKFASNQVSYKSLEEMLCSVLADTYRILINTQGIHWNARGRSFFGLHKLTEEQYEDLFEAVDEIAERIRALGYPAPQTFEAMLRNSTVSDIDAEADLAPQLDQLADAHQALADRIKAIVADTDMLADLGTSDLLTSRVRIHEKFAWLLRSVAA